jgi:hypothetical protein
MSRFAARDIARPIVRPHGVIWPGPGGRFDHLQVPVTQILLEAIDHLARSHRLDHPGVDPRGVPRRLSPRLVPWAVIESHVKTNVYRWVDG